MKERANRIEYFKVLFPWFDCLLSARGGKASLEIGLLERDRSYWHCSGLLVGTTWLNSLWDSTFQSDIEPAIPPDGGHYVIS